MKKITGLILAFCVLLTATGCNSAPDKNNDGSSPTVSQETSATEAEGTSDIETTEQSEPTEESTTEIVPTETEIQILEIEKKTMYECERSDEYGITLAESEYSIVLLGGEDAGRYPELAKALTESAAYQESNMKDEFDMLAESARESLSLGTENFQPLASSLDMQVRRADSAVLSVLSDSYLYNGMNDGSRSLWGSNYDTQTGKELFLPDVVTDIDKFAKAVENKLFSTVGADIFYSETIIEDYFKEYGADGTHWTLDYNGVTVYFGEGEITDAGFGALNVTVTFAEQPELFSKKYTEAPEAYIVALPMKSAFYTDLDGDGSCEELTTADSYNEESDYYATVDIYTAETSYTESFPAYIGGPYYVKTADGRHYLYLFAELQTHMYVYSITNGMINKVGEANAAPHYGDEISAVLTDPDNMNFDIVREETDGDVSLKNDFFSVGADGLPAQG